MSSIGNNFNKVPTGQDTGVLANTGNQANNPQFHIVKKNENLGTIAKKYFNNPNLYKEIFDANKSDSFTNPNELRIGQKIILPQNLFPNQPQAKETSLLAPSDTNRTNGTKKGVAAVSVNFADDHNNAAPATHTVQKGENLSSIAKKYFNDSDLYLEIFKENRDQLSHPNSILHEGMEIKLPQHLFANSDSKVQSVQSYHKENPLSFLTLEVPDTQFSFADTLTTIPNTFANDATSVDLGPRPVPKEPTNDAQVFLSKLFEGTKEVVLDDAVKVNKTFDLDKTVTLNNLKQKLDGWASKTAKILEENNVRIKVSSHPQGTIDAQFLRNFVNNSQTNREQAYNDLKNFFREDLDMAFVNTLWAIDDVANNIQSDPFYQKIKGDLKTIDLVNNSSNFQLANDRLNYLGNLASHRHRNVTVRTETKSQELNIIRGGGKNQTASEIISDLSKFFNNKGGLLKPAEFEEKVYALLEDKNSRRNLIKHFKLDNEASINALIPSIVAEGGAAPHQQDYNSYFAIGSVILNRALGKNLKKAAQYYAKGIDLNKIKPTTTEAIIKQEGQFAITWESAPGTNGRTLYDYQKRINQLYQSNKLNEDGNSFNSIKLANEAIRDLLQGENKLGAEVDGNFQKGKGRSTSDLFYFNQSRSHDYSRHSASAVKMTDKNDTHVFFKAWDERAYFM